MKINNRLKDLLAERFGAAWATFFAKRRSYEVEIEKSLTQLRETFGGAVVDAALEGEDPVKRTFRKKAKKQKTSTRRHLPTEVRSVVKGFGKKPFTTSDVGRVLARRGVKFDPAIVSRILAHDGDLRVVSKRKARGIKRNVWKRK